MLNLVVTCDGSGPWRYCNYFPKNASATSQTQSCDGIATHEISGKCLFNVQHWFRNNGIHSVIIIVTDGLTKIQKKVGITVFTGPR